MWPAIGREKHSPPPVPQHTCVPPCCTGPSSSFSNASCIDTVPVLEKPAPMTCIEYFDGSGLDGTPPMITDWPYVESSKKHNVNQKES